MHHQLVQRYISAEWPIWISNETIDVHKVDEKSYLKTLLSTFHKYHINRYSFSCNLDNIKCVECEYLKQKWGNRSLRTILNEEFEKFIGHLRFGLVDNDPDTSTFRSLMYEKLKYCFLPLREICKAFIEDLRLFLTDSVPDVSAFEQQVYSFIVQMMETPSGQRLILELNEELERQGRSIKIEGSKNSLLPSRVFIHNFDPYIMKLNTSFSYTFTIKQNQDKTQLGIYVIPTFLALFHELLHVHHDLQGKRYLLCQPPQEHLRTKLGVKSAEILRNLFQNQEEFNTIIGDSNEQELSEYGLYKERGVTVNRTHLGDIEWKTGLKKARKLNDIQFFHHFDSPQKHVQHKNLHFPIEQEKKETLSSGCYLTSRLLLRNQVYEKCNFPFVNFSGTDFSGSTFENCDLASADFSKTKLTGVRFVNTDVEKLNLGRGCNCVARLFGKRFVLQHIKGAKIRSNDLPEEKASSRHTGVKYLISKCMMFFTRSKKESTSEDQVKVLTPISSSNPSRNQRTENENQRTIGQAPTC